MTDVTQLPSAVSDADVDAARKALEGNGRAFDEPGVLDGTESSKADVEKNEETQIQKIEADNKPEVPKPANEINKLILEAKEECDKIKQLVKALNADKNAVIEGLEAKGVDRHTFRYACKCIDMDDDQRARVDLTNRLVRSAAGKHIQDDWIASDAGETKH